MAAEPVLLLDEAVLVEGLTLDPGALRVVVGQSFAIPVAVGSRRVGVWLDGAGRASLSFADPGQAIGFADRQVRVGGVPAAAVAAVAHGERPYEDTGRDWLVLTNDTAWVDAAIAGGVPALAPADAARRFRRRWEVLGSQVGLPPEPAAHAEWLVIDGRLDHRLGYLRTGRQEGGEADRHVTFVRDRSPEYPFGTDDLSVIGREQGHVAWRTLALPAWREPEPDPGCRVVDADLIVDIGQQGVTLDIVTTGTWSFVCTEPDARVFVGAVDSVGAQTTLGMEVDGATVAPGDGWVTIAGPSARVTRTDRWRGDILAGQGSLMVYAVTGHAAPGVSHDVVVHHPKGLGVALPGIEAAAEGSDAVTRRTEVLGQPWVAVGRFETTSLPADGDLPAVAFRAVTPAVRDAEVALLVQTMVGYGQRFLSPLHESEFDVIAVPYEAGFGLKTKPGLMVLGRDPLAEQHIARAVAEQWWGHDVEMGLEEDGWLLAALGESFACLYLGARYGSAACVAEGRAWRAHWRRIAAPAALRQGGSERDPELARGYGSLVLLEMIRPRIGNEGYAAAIDGFTRRYARSANASVGGLQAALEATSGRSWADFFDYWIDAGFLPAITVTWDDAGASVASDVPFGVFDFPLHVRHGEASEVVWVEVRDGVGRASWAAPATDVLVDIDGPTLLRSARVVRSPPP